MRELISNIKELEKKDKIVFFLIGSTIANTVVAIVKFILSLTIPSMWFFVNAIFSFVLAICRFLTVKRYGKSRKIKNETERLESENKIYMHNGVFIVLLGIAYFFVSSYMYFKGTNTTMHEYITYLVALMAFYSIGSAIYGMIKYKRNEEPIIKGIKITKFANALTSIVLTQVVLLDTFSETAYDSRINGYTGMGVSLIIIILGLYMILSTKRLTD